MSGTTAIFDTVRTPFEQVVNNLAALVVLRQGGAAV
jgi:hypothetical protein